MNAEFYDTLYREHVKVHPSEQVVAFIESRRDAMMGLPVLDAGCGAGRHALYMARRGLITAGIDPSEVAIRHAKAWAQSENQSVDFHVASFRTMPFSEDSFNAVVAWECLFYGSPDEVDESIAALFRVLKPGGHFLFMLKSPDDFRFQSKSAGETGPAQRHAVCMSEHGLALTGHTRAQVEEKIQPRAANVVIENLCFSINNGRQMIVNHIVTGTKKTRSLRVIPTSAPSTLHKDQRQHQHQHQHQHFPSLQSH